MSCPKPGGPGGGSQTIGPTPASNVCPGCAADRCCPHPDDPTAGDCCTATQVCKGGCVAAEYCCTFPDKSNNWYTVAEGTACSPPGATGLDRCAINKIDFVCIRDPHGTLDAGCWAELPQADGTKKWTRGCNGVKSPCA